MSNDPERYVDVDFTKEPEYVFGDLGANIFAGAPVYEDSVPILSWNEIDEAIDEIAANGTGADQLVTRIFGQKREGSCVANATGSGIEVIQAKQFGPENVIPVSAISLYKRIGRSPNSGSSVSDAFEEISTRGILPLDTPENRAKFGDCVMPNTGFYEAMPANWEQTAAGLILVEGYVIRSLLGIYTALVRREPVIVGREGHSINYLLPKRSGARRSVDYVNSWDRWGHAGGNFDYGFGTDTERQTKKSASWAYAMRTIRRAA